MRTSAMRTEYASLPGDPRKARSRINKKPSRSELREG